MQITEEQLVKIVGKSKYAKDLAEVIEKVLEKYQINTQLRVCHFLAQVGHESGGFNTMLENLNYSADGLQKIFKKYFPDATAAAAYARNPEKIANKVYGGRMGNGPEASGEGWKFRGRGFIQLTGKDNYTKFAAAIGKSLDDTVKYLETVEGGIESAAWFWNSRNINAKADADDLTAVTKLVNGGTHGIDDRKKKLEAAKAVIV